MSRWRPKRLWERLGQTSRICVRLPVVKNGKKKKQRRHAFRTTASSRDTRFPRLRRLDCFDEIKTRIKAGHSPTKIAEWLQEEKGVLEDAAREGVVKMIRSYRETFADTELIQDRIPEVFEKAADRVHHSIDELTELEKLYQLQMERVQIDVDLERKFNKLLPSVTQEIRTAREILGSIAELKMDLGINDRNLGKVDIEAKIGSVIEDRYGDSKIGKVLADSEKRQKLLGIAKQMAKKASAQVIDVPGEEATKG